MKKILSILFAIMMLVSTVSAFADPVILDPSTPYDVKINPAGDNEVPAGTSPTTGRALGEIDYPEDAGYVGLAVTGRYTPALVQIDNTDGGIGNRAPWNATYADIVYETPLYKKGNTRISFLFSDIIPDYVGPVRSARVHHVWLREEWDAAFVFWGGQQYEATNIYNAFRELGHKVEKDYILYDGTNGAGLSHPWIAYMGKSELLSNPHNAYAMLSALMTQVYPQGYVPARTHAYRFTDELPTDGDEATVIHVSWGEPQYSSLLEYYEEENLYYRYMGPDFSEDSMYNEIAPVVTKADKIIHGDPVTFSNVIVQWVQIEYPTTDGPKPIVTGTGNADYFMGGRHMTGVWNRNELTDRTVFYGMDGNEIELQRGHTLIIMMDYLEVNGKKSEPVKGRSISYE